MKRGAAEIVLTAVAPLGSRQTVLEASGLLLPPYRWRAGRAQLLQRAEASADGRVFRLSVRPARLGALLRVSGPGAAEPEVLAPLAARMRRALQLDTEAACARVLCGTSLWEDLATALILQLAGAGGAAAALHGLLTLGVPCCSARTLRTFPPPVAVAAVPLGLLGTLTGLGPDAAALRALARDLAAVGDVHAVERRLQTASVRAVRAALRRLGITDPATLRWTLARLGRGAPMAVPEALSPRAGARQSRATRDRARRKHPPRRPAP